MKDTTIDGIKAKIPKSRYLPPLRIYLSTLEEFRNDVMLFMFTYCPASIDPVAKPKPPHTERMTPDCAVEVPTTIEKYAGLFSFSLNRVIVLTVEKPVCPSVFLVSNKRGITNKCLSTD